MSLTISDIAPDFELILPRALSVFMNGLAMDGQFSFRIPKISRPYAQRNWVTWQKLNPNLKNETRR